MGFLDQLYTIQHILISLTAPEVFTNLRQVRLGINCSKSHLDSIGGYDHFYKSSPDNSKHTKSILCLVNDTIVWRGGWLLCITNLFSPCEGRNNSRDCHDRLSLQMHVRFRGNRPLLMKTSTTVLQITNYKLHLQITNLQTACNWIFLMHIWPLWPSIALFTSYIPTNAGEPNHPAIGAQIKYCVTCKIIRAVWRN